MKRRPYQEMLARWLVQREQVRNARVKLGMEGYAFLCAMLRQQPCTAPELRECANLGHVAAYRFLMTMYALKRVHISDWRLCERMPVLPVFALGAGADVPPPAARPNGRRVLVVNMPRTRLCAGVLAFVTLLRAIEVPSSRLEIVAATGLNHTTVQNALDALVGLNLAHIAMWLDRPQGGAPMPQFQGGAGRNAARPPRNLEGRRELLGHRAAQSRVLRRLGPMVFGAAMHEQPRPQQAGDAA